MNKLTLDAAGMLCPLPVLKARKGLTELAVGDVLVLLADDPAAVVDVPHFCQEAGHTLIEQDHSGPVARYSIRKEK